MPNNTEQWEQTTFSEEFNIKSGDFLPTQNMDNMGIFDVYGGNGITGKHNQFNCSGENIIIGRVGEKCGNIHYVNDNIWVTDNAFILTKTKHEFFTKFLYYLLFNSNLRKYATKSTHPVISGKSLKDVRINFPISIQEQQRIVGILDEAFENIEKAKQNTLQNLNNAKELFENLLNETFINNTDSWNKKSLEEIVSKEQYSIKRGPFGSSLTKSCFVPKGIRVFEQYNPINNDPYWARYYITEEKYKELKAFTAKAGDLLVSCSGTLGRIVELPEDVELGIINQALLKIKLDNSKILNKFFIYLFRSNDFQNKIFEYSQGVAIPNMVGVKELKKIIISYPSIEEQQKVVQQLDKLQEQTKQLEQIYEQKLKDLDELKQSILQKAFNGEL